MAQTTVTTTAPAVELEFEMSTMTDPGTETSNAVSIEATTAPGKRPKNNFEAFCIITVLAGVTFISVSGSGILTTALPQIATDIHLSRDLIFGPASVYALAAGCTLLAFGSVADIVGSKRMWLLGSGVSCPLILACGLARTGNEFIILRAVLGLFVAMCLPTSMSLLTVSFPSGPRRNIAFAATGMGQPLGYAMGLILGGVLTDSNGWR